MTYVHNFPTSFMGVINYFDTDPDRYNFLVTFFCNSYRIRGCCLIMDAIRALRPRKECLTFSTRSFMFSVVHFKAKHP